jgi:cell division control protein 7
MLKSIPEIGRYFIINGKLGEGTFSKVYRAKSVSNYTKEYALKYIIPTIKPSRIANELRFLRDLGGSQNIIQLKTCFFANGHTVLVMPIFPHQKFNDYVSQLSVDEVQHYMKNLLIALEKVHSNRIIHRDIKPANFLYDRNTRRYALVDFGLAQNERELIRSHNNSVKLQSNKVLKNDIKFKMPHNINNKIDISTKRMALNDCTSSTTNKILIKNETKWQIRKRSRNEAQLKERPGKLFQSKKPRIESSNIDSSVFNSPLTPTVFKSPTNKSDLKHENTVTPIKCQISIIPETPPKSLQKNLINKKMNNQLNDEMIPNEVNETPKSRYKKVPKKPKTLPKNDLKCECLASDKVCSVCKSKPDLIAPRAGTPGFRAPEVLFKYLQQTTLIDIWSAGVIFACLLSGRYPFFRNIDDMTSLAEIMTVLGSKRVQKAAKDLGKTLIVTSVRKPMDLKVLCEDLRGDNTSFKAPDSAYDLLDKLLDPNPRTRLTASKALQHEFFSSNN